MLPSHQGEGKTRGGLGRRGQGRPHKGSHKKLSRARVEGVGVEVGSPGGKGLSGTTVRPWLGPLLPLAATHRKAGPSLLTQLRALRSTQKQGQTQVTPGVAAEV